MPRRPKRGRVVAIKRKNRLIIFRALSTAGRWKIIGNIPARRPRRKRARPRVRTRLVRVERERVRERVVPVRVSEPGTPQVIVMEKEKPLANSMPLGMVALGITTVFLSLFNAGVLNASGLGVLMVTFIFYGGVVQIIAGSMEFKRGSTFGTVAFCSYGAFWMGTAALNILPILNLAQPAGAIAMGFYYMIWGILSIYLFILSLRLTEVMQAVFFTLSVMFCLLTIANFTGIGAITVIAGGEGIFSGFLTVYLALAEAVNDIEKRMVLPT
ncbi:MAG: acetate uptake transporter [Candidatus Hadarchaeales archaeon]